MPSPGTLSILRGAEAGAVRPSRDFAGFADPYFNAQQAAQAATETQAVQVAAADSALAVRGVPLVRRAAPAGGSAASFGLKDLPRLPNTGPEIGAIAVALNADPSADVFTGAKANEAAIKSMDLSDRRVIAFATHGLIAGELDGLAEPALALTDPGVAGTRGEDGLLTMSEIMALDLNADWIVLSACNTASGDGRGAEAISGLGSAFFYAGARALLATSWPVETTSARELTTSLFALQTEQPGLSRAEALRQSMLDVMTEGAYGSGGGDLYAYAHPIFWAPFILVGDVGTGQPGAS